MEKSGIEDQDYNRINRNTTSGTCGLLFSALILLSIAGLAGWTALTYVELQKTYTDLRQIQLDLQQTKERLTTIESVTSEKHRFEVCMMLQRAMRLLFV